MWDEKSVYFKLVLIFCCFDVWIIFLLIVMLYWEFVVLLKYDVLIYMWL